MITEVEERKVHVTYTAEEVDPEASYIPELEEGADTGPAGWFKQSPVGLPGVAIQ